SSLQCGFGIPYQARVDQQIGAVAQSLASFADQRDIGLLILPHGIPAELDGRESLAAIAARQFARLLRRRAEQRAGVTADLLVEAAAQQLPDRQSERFAFDVPQRHVDAADGVQACAAASAIDVCAVPLVPAPLSL